MPRDPETLRKFLIWIENEIEHPRKANTDATFEKAVKDASTLFKELFDATMIPARKSEDPKFKKNALNFCITLRNLISLLV